MEIGVISIVLAVLFFGIGWAGTRGSTRRMERRAGRASGGRRGRAGSESWWARSGDGGGGHAGCGSSSGGGPSCGGGSSCGGGCGGGGG